MKIIIAPAKNMRIDTDAFVADTEPLFLKQTHQLLVQLEKLSYEELKILWNCSDKIAQANYQNLQKLDLSSKLTPAVMAYVGIQYQYMAPDLMTENQLQYLQDNLRILSGFYGILRPFDGIVPYRLEMQSRLVVGKNQDLYQFWGSKLYQELFSEKQIVVNLASKEYTKAVAPFLEANDQLITCIFGELVDGKIKQKSTAAKMARGEMVNFMATKQINEVDQLKKFDRLNYRYQAEFSTPEQLVFIKLN